MQKPKSNGPFTYTTCGICGKEYIRIPGSIYKVRFAGKTYHCCGYACYQKALKIKESCNEHQYQKLKKES